MIGGEATRCTGGDEVGEQDVESVDRLGACPDQVVTVFDRRAQGVHGALDNSEGQSGCAAGRDLRTCRLGVIVIAAVTSRE